MKIKSGLVFCKATGKLVGFTELGDTNEAVAKFGKSFLEKQNMKPEDRSIAKYVVVFMVRGLFSSLCYPFGHFASEGFNSDQLYHCAWEAVGILESLSLKVRAVIADGAATK